MIRIFIIMLQFLTKLPLPFDMKATREDFQKGILAFPMVGLVIGAMLAGLSWLGLKVFSFYVVAAIVLVFEVFITGGLHLDGLADTFDGLYSYRDKEKMLEIMKDSRVGTNGVLVLIGLLGLKFVMIADLIHQETYWCFWLLALMPMVGRFMGVFLAYIGVYAREKGMGGFFIGHTKLWQMLTALAFVVGVMIENPILYIPLALMMALTLGYNYHVKSKIGGITGDILGAWIEMSEVIFLILVMVI